jgi:hypothetical protein
MYTAFFMSLKFLYPHESVLFFTYRISRPVRHTFFFSEKCDLNSNCVLCTEGKYLFPKLQIPLHLLVTLSENNCEDDFSGSDDDFLGFDDE